MLLTVEHVSRTPTFRFDSVRYRSPAACAFMGMRLARFLVFAHMLAVCRLETAHLVKDEVSELFYDPVVCLT